MGLGIYQEDAEEAIRAEQEEMWYLQEAKKAEEEAYQAQFGANSSYYEEEDVTVDKRMKGVRVK